MLDDLNLAADQTPNQPSQPDNGFIRAERLIRFESAEDFMKRPLYRRDLDVSGLKLVKPVGGYSFPPEKYTTCGLSCRRMHGLGLVLLLDNGFETNVGHCCGRSKFDLQFKEMEDQFEAISREYVMKDLIARATRERDERLRTTRRLIEGVQRGADLIRPIVELLESDKVLLKAFIRIVKSGGQLTYERPATEDEKQLNPGQYYISERLGQIDGLTAFENQNLLHELRIDVLGPLHTWHDVDLDRVSKKKVEELLKVLTTFGEVTRRAQEFIAQAERFTKQSNWRTLERYCVANSIGASHKTLQGLRQLGGVPLRRY